MNYKSIKYFGIILTLMLAICAFAQQHPQSEEEELKQIETAIEKRLEDLESSLGLEDWQLFYVDSILHHDYNAMRVELKALNLAKVGNTEAYSRIQDKWTEQMYQAFSKVFDKEQWAKYLKTGAAKEKKARDKRESKRKS